jgi:hypothetical protein
MRLTENPSTSLVLASAESFPVLPQYITSAITGRKTLTHNLKVEYSTIQNGFLATVSWWGNTVEFVATIHSVKRGMQGLDSQRRSAITTAS